MKQSLTLLGAALLGAASLPALAQKPARSHCQRHGRIGARHRHRRDVGDGLGQRHCDRQGARARSRSRAPKASVKTVTAGPDVRNFDQIKVGDTVTVRYVEALTLTLKKDGKELRSMTETPAAVRAPAGERPRRRGRAARSKSPPT